MAYVVPESILPYQVCTSCNNYLSLPPIKVYRNGEIKCGRCSVENDEGTVSIFHTLARTMLFPCINRFGGCSALLHYTDVKEHEKNCTGFKELNCFNFKSTRLSFLHKIIKFNRSAVLVIPEITCSWDKKFNKSNVYCDYAKNVYLFLHVSWDLKTLFISYSPFVTAKQNLKVTLLVTTDDADPKQCKDLTCILLHPFKRHIYEVPDYLTSIKCKWIFDLNEFMITIPGCLSTRSTEERRSYNFYLDKKLKEKYRNLDLTAVKISDCRKKLVLENNSLHIACDFCENMFASSGYVPDVYSDGSSYVCGTCYIRGVTKSLANNGNSLKTVKDFDYHLLSYYCRFDCGKFFRSGDLLSHEDQCIFNGQRDISDDEFVKVQFGDVYTVGVFSKENVIFDLSRFQEKGKIFVATRDSLKCVIDYDVDDNLGVCNFHVNHRYDTKTHYIAIHKWEDQTYSEVSNDFSMKIKNADESSLFALTVKVVQKDLKFAINI